MTAHELEDLTLLVSQTSSEADKGYDNPLDISDIINICKEFNKLGSQIQNHIENILELGVEESIKIGHVKPQSLPHIKHFLLKICENAYFGEAIDQAQECVFLIENYQENNNFIKSELN